MITTRERITPAEVMRGIVNRNGSDLIDYFRGVLPVDKRHCLFTNQGKSAFEQIVRTAGLRHCRILAPAFFPDDFVGIFQKYDITPVFVDVDPERFQLDLDAVPDDLDGVKAMIILHTFGLPAEGRRYREFCDKHGILLIEDCARALGAMAGADFVGSFGHFALFSLPKCTPVRQGGIAVSEQPLQPHLEAPKVGFTGLLHALTLVKYPLVMPLVEYAVYNMVADTPLYPREVGIYELLPSRHLDSLGRTVLTWYMPNYIDAIAKKRARASRLRNALEPLGFRFQADDGNHIYTALSVEPPASFDADEFYEFLVQRGVKASTMWRNSLALSEYGQQTWNTVPDAYPVARRLAKRQVQLPVSRFQSPRQTERMIDECKRFVEAA
jgi:dTDP-4-amino-4,6-dideoxygalactose transaminase